MLKLIKSTETINKANGRDCNIQEYPLGDNDIDLATATITGRYPENGYCVNTISKELVYILEGSVTLCLKDNKILLSKGDLALIDCGDEYYWDAEYCKMTITCTPPWNMNQYRLCM